MYSPKPFFGQVSELPGYVRTELEAIAREWDQEVHLITLQKLNAAPVRVREGQVVLADGVNWNPGSGPGFYGYRGGAWHFLG